MSKNILLQTVKIIVNVIIFQTEYDHIKKINKNIAPADPVRNIVNAIIFKTEHD